MLYPKFILKQQLLKVVARNSNYWKENINKLISNLKPKVLWFRG